MSDSKDIDWIINAFPSHSNGLTLCSGSLGASPNNNVVEIAQRYADRIHFAHLRNVRNEPDGSFEETAHLEVYRHCSYMQNSTRWRKETAPTNIRWLADPISSRSWTWTFIRYRKRDISWVSTYRKAPRTCGNPRRYSCSGLMIKIEGLVLKFKKKEWFRP